MKAEDGDSEEVEDADNFAIDLEERMMVFRMLGYQREESYIIFLYYICRRMKYVVPWRDGKLDEITSANVRSLATLFTLRQYNIRHTPPKVTGPRYT